MGERLNRLVLQTTEKPQAIFDRLVTEVNADLAEVVKHDLGSQQVVLAVFEKFYFRVESYVSVTLHLTSSAGWVVADVIGSGGGGGFLNISWGANSDFASLFTDALRKQGFEWLNTEK
ncbi:MULTISPECIES: DUF6054 family protein [unclassified Streptococcus]|uniref:DUF6054 family protein n=1 Tax=unclassified Streptococcus TaxID=2608887 RepID=UPI00359DEBDA